MFHIIMTLLIYGVDTESVKCPESCTCVETLISKNNTNSPNQINFDGRNFNETRLGQNLNTYKIILNSVGTNEVKFNSETHFGDNKTSSPLDYSKGKKCSKNAKESVRDIFINNFSKKMVNNSKEIRIKRTLKLNVNSTANVKNLFVGTNNSVRTNFTTSEKNKLKRPATEGKNAKSRGIFTYQITCNGVRDVKSLWLQYLPNPTTRLIIRQTYFQSFRLFRQILRESPVKFNQLAILSVSDSVINQRGNKKYFFKSDPINNGENLKENLNENEEFLPFALLQNPKLRSKSELEFPYKGKFKNVKVLNLINNTITFLPQDTFHPFQNLEILNLSNNLLKFIDNETFNPLTNLLQLDIHKNLLLYLNEVMFRNLTKLLYLDVSQNSISNIAPSTFQYLVSLNILNLANNPLSEKQEAVILFGTGKRLQVVDISKTGLKQIPGTLERSVRVLNLMGNHLLSIRCGDLDSYSLLSFLNLQDNKISYVEDDALGRLEFLISLQISENNLFQIPKSLPNNLEILNLSHNNIQNITNSDFLNLFLMKELFVSYNQVSSIEGNAFSNLNRLEVLDLSHNPILILPNVYGLAKLTTLNLSYFTNIPGSISVRYKQFPIQSPYNIKKLNLESSPLLTTLFLQDTKTLESFTNLEELDIRFSNLTTIRKDIFSLLPKLKVLKMEGNPWHCGKEILMLSDWLKSHEKENVAEEEDEINTAHCSTPVYLYKTSLITLEKRDFEVVENKKKDEESKNLNKTVGKEIEMKNFSEKRLEISESATETQDKNPLNTTNFFEREKNFTLKNSEVQKVNLKNYYKSDLKVKTWLNQKTKGNLGVKNIFPKSKDKRVSEKNSPVTQSPPNKRIATETSQKITANSSFWSNYGNVIGWNDTTEDFGITVKNLLDLKTTPLSFRTLKKAEAVTAKDSLSLEKEYNSHLSFFILTSIGLIVMATLTFTSVYFSRVRRDQSYQRQNQDIEVCSISSIGNELW